MGNKKSAADKLRAIKNWLGWQDEFFNDKLKSIADIERCYDACQNHDIEFADNLEWEDEDDEEYKLAKEVNNIIGENYYNIKPEDK